MGLQSNLATMFGPRATDAEAAERVAEPDGAVHLEMMFFPFVRRATAGAYKAAAEAASEAAAVAGAGAGAGGESKEEGAEVATCERPAAAEPSVPPPPQTTAAEAEAEAEAASDPQYSGGEESTPSAPAAAVTSAAGGGGAAPASGAVNCSAPATAAEAVTPHGAQAPPFASAPESSPAAPVVKGERDPGSELGTRKADEEREETEEEAESASADKLMRAIPRDWLLLPAPGVLTIRLMRRAHKRTDGWLLPNGPGLLRTVPSAAACLPSPPTADASSFSVVQFPPRSSQVLFARRATGVEPPHPVRFVPPGRSSSNKRSRVRIEPNVRGPGVRVRRR